MDTPTTLQEAIRYLADSDRCLNLMIQGRWPDGKVKCPTCGSEEVRFLATRRHLGVQDEASEAPVQPQGRNGFRGFAYWVDRWVTTAWLIANCKNGISRHKMARDLGVTQKTTWFMDHRIGHAMETGTLDKIAGMFEADGSFIGGLARFMHKDKKPISRAQAVAVKVLLMGILDREHGKIRPKQVPNVQRETLRAELRANIVVGSEASTDAWVAYTGLDREYVHGVINLAGSYVNGRIHTNGIENFWSLPKRGLKGTYVSV